ncbi:hypothetical protein MS3_00002474 [Schistosoma haematobium]|uniref:Uncharacterized protein n=1 Tax=Schistosoma haematobium TaxID=6185 RepID=A0A922S7E5_SCHHA|nr:hypothetical protein MS3_00002474 [Schistosoma haematobium]KAH9596986.1 hypothetical protein MS3_00002474 [Schistosoma haematobium]CAH8492762.1 unnamed protein product [Schistosoma haematobium]
MMISLLIISLLFCLCFNCELHNQSLHNNNNNNNNDSIDYHLLWTIWKLRYHQYYRNQIDEINSFALWKININQILLHNLYYDLQLKTYRKSINQYTAINWNDFYQNKKNKLNLLHHQKNRLLLLLVKEKYRSFNRTNNNHNNLPDMIDWRDNDTVTPVKTQEDCASSWAIASVEALEGQVKRKTGILTPLSSQQLVDCTGDHECVEYPVSVAFDFIKEYGVESQEDYPFTGKVGNCTYSSSKSVTTLSSYIQVDDNEEELQKAVYNIGPIAVRITMTQEFLTYGSGVLLIDDCQNEEPFESVLLVGYGIENGIPYWLVKFSLGEEFGDHGYMKLARNHNNMCHIASFAYYPVI